MNSELEIVLAVVAVGIALAGLIAAQGAARRKEVESLRKEVESLRKDLRSDIGDLRHEMQKGMSSIRDCLARLEAMTDIFWAGMQLHRTVPAEHPKSRIADDPRSATLP